MSIKKLGAGGTILTGQWRNFDLFWPRARRKHGQITFCPSIPKDNPKRFTTNSFWENLHENRTPEFKPSCGKQHCKKKNQIKYKNNNNKLHTDYKIFLALPEAYLRPMLISNKAVFLPAYILSTVPWFMTPGKALWIHNITPGGESWKTKKGFEMHSFSHIPLTSWVVFSAHINGIYCASNTISCSARYLSSNGNGDYAFFSFSIYLH